MNKIIRFVPNFITLMNLLFGIFSILFSLSGWFMEAGLMIGIAAVFDFFDGFTARLLKAGSELGKQLDSLSDMVSFGLAPGLLVYAMIEQRRGDFLHGEFLSYLAFLIPLLSAYRLAKFNIDERQSDRFFGLPTPANALVVASFPWIAQQHTLLFGALHNPFASIVVNPVFLAFYAFVFSILLVAEIPLFSLKVKSYKWKDNVLVFSFLIFAVLAMLLLHYTAVPFIIVVYILLSVSKTGKHKYN